jgi:hypothetical protein
MPLWAVLLAIQLGVFSKPSQPDRTFKFIRAAYVWLIIANAMMPFLLVYGILTRQGFAHAYMGAHRHAFTVGFISMMIMGVSARVVPILAGVDARKLSNLWGPFVLITTGNSGRVLLQIATDFYPNIAYPLVGLTGFIEVTALAWWGIGLWRVMNRSHNKRTATMVGGGALAGAIIGAIAGGGKGAAIGAAVGGAAGAGAQVLTRGKEVKVPAETVLTFQLDSDLQLQAQTNPY